MIEVNGKQIYTDLAEIVDPRHTALVLVDMQRDFVAPDGLFGTLGIDLSMYEETLPPSGRSARRRETPRCGSDPRTEHRTGRRSQRLSGAGAVQPAHARRRTTRRAAPARTVPGTPGHEFVRELAPEGSEPVVRKYRSSGFWGTNLDLVLRSNGIKTVVVTGCTTEGCVEFDRS